MPVLPVIISIETIQFNGNRKKMNCFIRIYLNGVASINFSPCMSNYVERVIFSLNMNLWTLMHPGSMGHT